MNGGKWHFLYANSEQRESRGIVLLRWRRFVCVAYFLILTALPMEQINYTFLR